MQAGRTYTRGVDTALTDPLLGRELDGRYRVRSRIARGGMATVYLGVDTRLDREIALKVMHAHLADDPQFTDRFIREARSTARLSHPNVVQVYDQGQDGDVLYLTMEYLRGRTLRDVLAERGVLTAREAFSVIEPVLDALAAAHRLGIVHRDVKPENVVLTDEGRVKVADFGLARAATAHTSTGDVVMGTVAYLAPELVVRGVSDTRSDVYAAGIMLFEVLTGRQPFGGDAPIQVAYQHVNDQVPAPSSIAPQVPAALDDVVAAATARDPDQRPADAGELLTAVRAAHATLGADQLDVRPAAPPADAPGVGAPGNGVATEMFVPGAEAGAGPGLHQRTRALPELGRPGHGAPVPLYAPTPGPHPVATEDAALAVMLRRRRRIGLAALLTVIGLALALALGAWYFADGPGAYTATPTVTGMTAEKAQQALNGHGLRSHQEDTFSDTVAAGTVAQTVPGPGEDVRKDGVVVLKVSRGPAVVTVPPLKGKQEAAARQAITDAHLTVGDVAQVYDDNVPRGQVLDSDPAEGGKTANGTAVKLRVSRGPAPVEVPDLHGLFKNDAEGALADVKLTAQYSGQGKNDDEVPEGAIISQTPAAHSHVEPGTAVTLVVSLGPPMVDVPDVVGKQSGEATAILERAGFKVKLEMAFGGFFGTVRFEKPNHRAPRGSTITLTVI